jgi:hypothetical protein
MRFQKLLADLLTENVRNKKLFEFMLKKWYGETPTENNIKEGEVLFDGFDKIKKENRLRAQAPEVKAFLLNFPNFDVNNLADIRYYTVKQIEYIVSEFVDINITNDNDPTPEIFRGKNLPPTDERIEASKNLWYGTANLIIDKGNVRVYKIHTRKDSINFGYYLKHLIESDPYIKLKHTNQWCITRHTEQNNAYGGYRDIRTFYFVIDESKSPKNTTDKNKYIYYLSALQSAMDTPTKFRLTPIENDGSDPAVTPEDVYKIYPELKGEMEKIIFKKFDPSELGEVTDVIEYINENSENKYEFAKVNTTLKKRYIDKLNLLRKARSWETMTTQLKQSYIDYTTPKNVNERFSSEELLKEILKSKSETYSLNRKLEGVGAGSIDNLLSKHIIDLHRPDQRVSILNKNVSLMEHKTRRKFGLWNKNKGSWIEFNGVKYESYYSVTDSDFFTDENGNVNLVEVYTINNNEDDTSFYCVFPPEGNNINGYFMTRKSWLNLKEKLESSSRIKVGFKPDDESDIKEYGGI